MAINKIIKVAAGVTLMVALFSCGARRSEGRAYYAGHDI